MIVDLVIKLLVGGLTSGLGFYIWKYECIALIHSYHHKRVKLEDKKAYTKLMGQGMLTIGIGLISSGVIGYMTTPDVSGVITVLSLILGFVIMHKAQKKYNNGWF